jgi:hypothetical protein
MAPFSEVMSALEVARQRAWSERSPKHSVGMNRGHRGNSNHGTLPNSHSQPIYVPGKYSVSLLMGLIGVTILFFVFQFFVNFFFDF